MQLDLDVDDARYREEQRLIHRVGDPLRGEHGFCGDGGEVAQLGYCFVRDIVDVPLEQRFHRLIDLCHVDDPPWP